jgi:hypothetical protein
MAPQVKLTSEIKKLLPPGEDPIAVRSDAVNRRVYVVCASGKEYTFGPEDVRRTPDLRGHVGGGGSGSGDTERETFKETIERNERDAREVRDLLKKQMEQAQFEKKWQEYRDKYEGKDGKDGEKKDGQGGGSKARTFDEAWEMAEARLAEWERQAGRKSYPCDAYWSKPKHKAPNHKALAVVLTKHKNPSKPGVISVPLCKPCALKACEKNVAVLDCDPNEA